jgi:hypothetical protein
MNLGENPVRIAFGLKEERGLIKEKKQRFFSFMPPN